MKLKYILPFFVTALAFLTGCSDKQESTYLDGLRVSTSYVTIPLEGGTKTVDVTADADWAIDAADIPAWLTITPASGSAGTTAVTFSAGKGEYGQVITLRLVSAGRVQEINVQQGLPTPELATCAEIAAGPDGKQFRVRGKVTKIANTTYGNWYLADETGEVYIYGTLDKDGKTKNFASLNIEEGDVVTVEGPKKDYNGTIELVDVTVVNIEKTLVKVITAAPAKVSKEGGEIEVEVDYKGIGVVPVIAADCDWVHQTGLRLEEGIVSAVDPNPANKAFVKFKVDVNEGNFRKTSIEFKSVKEGNESSVTFELEQEANVLPHGQNPEDPYTPAELNAYCQSLGEGKTSEVDVYVKGIIVKYASSGEFGTKYGNASFYISDDGSETAEQFYVFRTLYLGNVKYADESLAKPAVGDEVVICGKVTLYKDSKTGDLVPETSANNSYLYSFKKVSVDPGSKAKPFTPAEANAFCQTLTPGNPADDAPDYYVKGKIVKYADKGEFGTQYGNASFYISVDGQESSDQFYVFRTLYLGNVKYTDDSWAKPAVGDEVVICGKLMLYKDSKTGNLIPETAANKSYLYSLNGKTN